MKITIELSEEDVIETLRNLAEQRARFLVEKGDLTFAPSSRGFINVPVVRIVKWVQL